MRALAGVLILCGGCAARHQGALEVLADAPGRGDLVQQSVEARHTERGWVEVRFDDGRASLPPGRYDALRVSSLSAPDAASPVRWIAAEALVERTFCIGSEGPALALEMARDDRALVTLDAPCDDLPARDRRAAARTARSDRP